MIVCYNVEGVLLGNEGEIYFWIFVNRKNVKVCKKW